MSETKTKRSYTVPCASGFRDAVLDLARRRGVNAADLARAVVLSVPPASLNAYPDPGGPELGDREVVVLKSGAAKGRPWRRKPRLQVRLQAGLGIPVIRRALAVALALDAGDMALRLEPAGTPTPADMAEELERLRAMVGALSFEPLEHGVGNRADALHVLGFPPGAVPSRSEARNRFRILATVHHPDSGQGSHQRMSQLNAAIEILGRGGG